MDVLRMEVASDRLADMIENKRFHFIDGDITISRQFGLEGSILRRCSINIPH